MSRDECRCSSDIEKLEMIDQYAETIAEDIAETVGGLCTPMFDFFAERLIARVAHMVVLGGDPSLGPENPKLLDAVEQRLSKFSGTAPAALRIILDEARAKEGATNARH
jgi:hypothetical protein